MESYQDLIDKAVDIYEKSVIGQSFGILGLVADENQDVYYRGDIVLEEMVKYDLQQCNVRRNRFLRKRRKIPENTIGAYMKWKQFKYKHEEIEGRKYVTIWRVA
jgi:hypothetical protein